VNRNEDTPTISLSRKRCLTLEMIRKLDRELKIPVDKRRPTLSTLIAALFYDLSTDKEIKIPSIGEERERELRSGVIMIARSYS
jgi:type II secretory pathway predicted ATPase ExeA